MAMLRVAEIMSREIVTVLADDDLLTARALFDRHKFHHLMVTENGRLIGVISDRDLLRNLSPFVGRLSERSQDIRTLYRRVHQMMTRAPVTVTSDALVTDAVNLMLSSKISCLPVVSFDGRPVGIVTIRGVLRALVPEPPSV
jgi:acetoin utilization protein AcuB